MFKDSTRISASRGQVAYGERLPGVAVGKRRKHSCLVWQSSNHVPRGHFELFWLGVLAGYAPNPATLSMPPVRGLDDAPISLRFASFQRHGFRGP